jgi:hypothetical protein
MNTILILKPIIDALYDEMKYYQDRTDKRIQWLEGQLTQYKNKESYDKFVNEVTNDIDDDTYAEAALAPPVANAQVEIKNELEKNTSITEEDAKTVKMIGGKDAKEYMKEYSKRPEVKEKQKDIDKNF